ncbi:hypothetical protein [Prevotella lacticifex]|uniref:hypothetical protein n=1 Tax=Prevotella lacticifex TaxID=2854755 RepID=UPI001CC63000|nr:hypothetical protein [Prevotella lacticifex]
MTTKRATIIVKAIITTMSFISYYRIIQIKSQSISSTRLSPTVFLCIFAGAIQDRCLDAKINKTNEKNGTIFKNFSCYEVIFFKN